MIPFFLLLILLALPIPFWMYSLWVQYDWSRAVVETDQLDPRWRLEQIEADRKQIPDEENAALIIMALVQADRKGLPKLDREDEDAIPKLHPTVQLNEQQITALREYQTKLAKRVQDARKLKDFSIGRYPIRYADSFDGTSRREQEKAWQVISWLLQDAALLVQDEEYDRAIATCRAMLVAARAFGDEPLQYSHLARIGQQSAALVTVERVLAQGGASEASLAALQRLLELEINESTWLRAARGDRAGFARMFDNTMAGKITLDDWDHRNPDKRIFLDDMLDFFFSALVLRRAPRALRIFNQILDHAQKPIHDRRIELRKLTKELDDDGQRAMSLMPAVFVLHDRDCGSQALLRSTLVGIACERYRLAHQRWPDSLESLLTDKLLDAVPLDPMDGQPLRYRRTDVGIVVYSIGQDEKDDQGKIDREKRDEPGLDIGFRLWNVTQRRQPAAEP